MTTNANAEAIGNTLTGIAGVVTGAGVLTFALFPFAIPIVVLTVVFTLPLLLPLLLPLPLIGLALAARALWRGLARRGARRELNPRPNRLAAPGR